MDFNRAVPNHASFDVESPCFFARVLVLRRYCVRRDNGPSCGKRRISSKAIFHSNPARQGPSLSSAKPGPCVAIRTGLYLLEKDDLLVFYVVPRVWFVLKWEANEGSARGIDIHL